MPLTGRIYVCGAGGKTTFIRQAAAEAAKAGLTVFVTTSTHMLCLPDTVTDPEAAASALRPGAVVHAGAPDPANPRKIIGFPEAEYRKIADRADLVLVEADGARHCRMKVPYAHEPVIRPDADAVYVLYGARAADHPIRDVCYNPEGVASILGVPEETVLTDEMIRTALTEGYIEKIHERFPGLPVHLVRGTERKWHLILLAAGYSKRFGANKLLYPLNGKPMFAHLGDTLLGLMTERAGGCGADLTVVTQYEEIRRAFDRSGARVVINPDPSRGISSSLQCALSDLMRDSGVGGDDFFVVFTADQPYLRAETIRGFLTALSGSGFRLGCLACGQEMKSPCAFAAEYLPELMLLRGDAGGKRILRQAPELVFLYPPESPEELEDIDYL